MSIILFIKGDKSVAITYTYTRLIELSCIE